MNIEAILAHNKDHVIGQGYTIPWKHKGDLQRFKKLTMGHNLLMGPKTFFGIAKLFQGQTYATVLPGRTIFLVAEPRQKLEMAPGEFRDIHKRGYGNDWVQLVHEVTTVCRSLGVSYENVRVILREGSPQEILARIEMNHLKNGETLLVAGGSAVYHDYLPHCTKIHQTIMNVAVEPADNLVKLTPETIKVLDSPLWLSTCEGIDGDAMYVTLDN